VEVVSSSNKETDRSERSERSENINNNCDRKKEAIRNTLIKLITSGKFIMEIDYENFENVEQESLDVGKTNFIEQKKEQKLEDHESQINLPKVEK